MESALPIAMADAQTQSQFESMNLSNRQQRIMLAAEQRAKFMGQEFDQEFQTRVINASKISDIANMNFTAEQQVQLENLMLVVSNKTISSMITCLIQQTCLMQNRKML